MSLWVRNVRDKEPRKTRDLAPSLFEYLPAASHKLPKRSTQKSLYPRLSEENSRSKHLKILSVGGESIIADGQRQNS